MRIGVVFEKGERLRHLGHLDLMRTMQRCLRRSGLPLSYSKGFNPHILLYFASALSVGAVGEHEIMEVDLDRNMDVSQFMNLLSVSCPPDLRILQAFEIREGTPALMSLVCAGAWRMEVQDPVSDQRLCGQVDAFLAQTTVMAMRKTKSGEKEVDIRPSVFSLEYREGMYHMVLESREARSCKPGVLLEAMCRLAVMDVPRVRLWREYLLGERQGEGMERLERLLCAN